ncbi:hypothetical protein ARC20_00685 [Stenotrophomonas panacihumi]|uniref:Uncharacterized protein n=2 Tax=Stenotrophomonas panacihumi TaxID=676599 RepID=A0A0R0AG96_9GAMM|nr:hypothetical protein ARC20_00685 [Stenotrophomonas panacihumi]PTN55692.1 hypothetical protein C9J98_03675 [Stenotrophomonas panacihumi]
MNVWRFGFWGWALFCAPAMAQEVQRSQQGRDVACEATPCIGRGTHSAWRVAVHPPPMAMAVAGRSVPRGAARRASGARRVRGAGKAPRARQWKGGSCESVRAQRAAAYEAVGLKRDFAMSSLWDNRVQQACK